MLDCLGPCPGEPAPYDMPARVIHGGFAAALAGLYPIAKLGSSVWRGASSVLSVRQHWALSRTRHNQPREMGPTRLLEFATRLDARRGGGEQGRLRKASGAAGWK